jgi:hypothetical protein
VKLNKYAGSAWKFLASSVLATVLTYALLALLGFLAWLDSTAGSAAHFDDAVLTAHQIIPETLAGGSDAAARSPKAGLSMARL